MNSGVPSTGDFRGPSRTPRSRLLPRTCRPADGCDVRLRSIRRRSPGAADLPPARRGQGERPASRARSSSRATTSRSSTRSPFPSRHRARCTSSRSRATSTAPASPAGSRASSSRRSAPSPSSAAPGRRHWTRSTSSASCSRQATRSRCIPKARGHSTAASTRAAPASPSSRCRAVRRSCRSA